MVYNALAGIAVGTALGMTSEEIRRGIEKLVPIAGRNNLIETEHYTIIDDCYNANPASMKASIAVLSDADTRTVAVLGDMFELGEDGPQMHYDTGKYAADCGIDVLVCIGGLSAEIARGARENLDGSQMEIHEYSTKDEFFKDAGRILQEKDTILVKASHGMEFSKIVAELQKA